MSNNTKPYRPGTTINQIVADGWSRGFDPDQTVFEASLMGYEISREEVLKDWAKLEYEMAEFFGYADIPDYRDIKDVEDE